MRRAAAALIVAVCVLASTATAQQPARSGNDEATTARYFASIRTDPSLLLVFLREMPKGGDLHNHLSGAIYAESFLQWAADDKLCLETATMTLVAATCDASTGRPPAAAVLENATLYNQAIDAMSMRNWDATAIGHDHFFATFGKFSVAANAKPGEMLAEVSARAAAEHVSYLELLVTPAFTSTTRLARDVVWDATAPNFAAVRDALLAAGLRHAVTAEATQRIDDAEARQRELLRCGTSQADAGCRVTIRYVSQVARASAPAVVFAQMLACFEAAQDPRVVGVNLVQPEDALLAVRDFSLQMSMLGFLHAQYPGVTITLHAGELTDGLVPPETLRFHIRDSVRIGHARRIGHGVDVMHEDDALALLREMAAKRVLVEIALTSNDVILGVKGKQHPLRTYLKYGVPVALVTDDAGVARSSLTLEFRKAVEEQGLDYVTLKRMVRNSLEFSFADDTTKTRLRKELEEAFRAFERRMSKPAP